MEETTKKRDSWPTGLFDCCSGGRSLCLWGFLCPLCLLLQGDKYSNDLLFSRSLTESQLERYPPFSCRGIAQNELYYYSFLSYCCCLFGVVVGAARHWEGSSRSDLEYYCSSRRSCCYKELSFEDWLVGCCCCCCSVVQVTMVNDERFRMRFRVEGDVNVKRAR